MPQSSRVPFRSALADRLLAESIRNTGRPVQSMGEGLARMGTQWVQAATAKRLREQDDADAASRNAALARALAGGDPEKEAELTEVANDPRLGSALASIYAQRLVPEAKLRGKDRYVNVPGQGLVDLGETGGDPNLVVKSPKAPKTVNTADGVFVLNPDGTLGKKLGGAASLVTINQAPKGYERTPSGLQPIPGGPADPEAIKKTEEAKASARAEVKKAAAVPKAKSALRTLESQSNVVISNIDKALKTISPVSTGYGAFLAELPNTDARKLKNYLDTIKANVGFDKLQQMRDNSPTGGALGQVSEFENRLLQAVQGALDPMQPDQLVENLKVIREMYPKVLAERRAAFESDYGEGAPAPVEAPAEPQENNDPLGLR